ncbi:hypothetical protein LF845_01060 [Deferribacterales bacterium Es71-Z0220]|jgi:methionyl-tRNA formyltransferase|uniref:formyltransferase family protein n=1 Tax=Deferrivibrio essentukiensis TaxID=2880922 RepID=UPI001F605B10|nr:formyltransferase family protein [Deferrivibrio essentukiensis]MCB4203543.1 hypothetical protein [Deferrivibrio essentukiensis]
MSFNVIYIGNLYYVPEYILMNDNLNLKGIVVERGKFDDNLFTFSLVRNIDVVEVENINKVEEFLKEKDIDFCIMCSFGKMLTESFLDLYEVYNIHYSYLPYYKGRHPTFWATINEELKVGISIHKVTSKVDSGDIISRKLVSYYFWENEKDIFLKLTNIIPELLNDLVDYKRGQLRVVRNIENKYYYPPVKEDDYTFDLKNDPPNILFNKVRAQARYKGAKLIYKNKVYYVKKLYFTQKPNISDKKIIPYKNNIFIVLEEFTEENLS